MKHFYLIENPEKSKAGETARQICRYLSEKGAFCLRQNGNPDENNGYKYTDAAKIPKEIECIITLGGDGTLIQAARDLAGKNLPMVGMNLGTLGYLTQISRPEEIYPALDCLLEDNFKLEYRMMLVGRTLRKGVTDYEGIALNEIVITRKDLLKVLKFRLYVNGQVLSEYTADGIIAATPTGSTAYNLSAGGPIVVPDAKMIILTPICPHTLNSRSIVLSGDDRILIEILGKDEGGQVAVFDGDTAAGLDPGDVVEISCSPTETVLLKLKNISFLDNLRNKMSAV